MDAVGTASKTKIVATLGPSSNTPEAIGRLIEAGVDVVRLNFSHGDRAQHEATLAAVRLACRSDRIVAVMGDLCGPKIRTSRIEPDGVMLEAGREIIIVPGLETGNAECFGTNYDRFAQDVKPCDRIFINDGRIALHVVDIADGLVRCRVDIGGWLKSRKGINLPDSQLSTPSITERDWSFVDWAIENDLDYLALSFVRNAADVIHLREYLRTKESSIKVVSKIETPQAIGDLENIVTASDVVLVARGDLGVEMPLEEVPLLQKRITHLCRQYGRPVIVATEMLQSMITQPGPTRAEVSDVSNAVLDLADAVMLSGETAVGQYPVEAVAMMNRINRTAEQFLRHGEFANPPRFEATGGLALRAALIRTVGQVAEELDAVFVAVWTASGISAQLLSKARIEAPILAMSDNDRICRQMALQYGVIPVKRPIPKTVTEFIANVDEILLTNRWAAPGDLVILLAGAPFTESTAVDTLTVHRLSK
ncbi:MAG: pyruvate kinase [Sedimentisphaerales bacterium]|nr:pyruvate kinase [Sedimentisphaerales bacterium]